MHERVIIIAEAGVNHNGSLSVAKKLIDVAKEAGADIVKFQTFNTEKLVTRTAPKAAYQKKTTGAKESQFEMLKKLELSPDVHKILLSYCRRKKIKFLSTPFDLDSIDLLLSLGIDTFKIPSGELNNLPYLEKIGKQNKKIIMSTGMADLKEVEDNLNVLIRSGTKKENITLLHCHSEYPTQMKDVNLRAMLTLKEKFGVAVGYSDHTEGIEVPIAAVALGATVIEKHFTLDKKMKGPDHKASLNPDELKAMIKAIRNIEQALGDGIKKPSEREIQNRKVARKSIHIARNLPAGTILSEEHLIMKRPEAGGISPMEMNNVIGKKLLKDKKTDEQLKWSEID
jgi:N,N'-diacetyllegionaminate synthase